VALKPFDVERLRRNWDLAIEPPQPPLPERIAKVRPPESPYPEARRLLERITATARSRFPSRQKALGPFLDEARRLVDRMEAAAAGAAAGEDDVAALRGELQKVLHDLEDLFEVYSGIGIP
jgi:hypothetical protein